MRAMNVLSAVVVGVMVLAPVAHAANVEVEMGGKNGSLMFMPKTLVIKKGDTVTWEMQKAGPHNVIFDAAPAGVDVKALSHPKLVNKTDPSFVTTFTVPGDYSYHCAPHKGAGMVGKITVQ